MADHSPLNDWIATHSPDIAVQKQIVDLLRQRVDRCDIAGCENLIIRPLTDVWEDPIYACLFCNKACCLAEHMSHVNLLERYSEAFIEAADYPDSEYTCNTCLAYIDAEYSLWLENPFTLRRDPSLMKFRKDDI